MKKYLFIVPVIALLTMVSCGPKEDKAVQQKEEKVKVKVSTVTEETIKQVEEFTATVEPEVKNNIVPAAPGRIRKIMVEVGLMLKRDKSWLKWMWPIYRTWIHNSRTTKECTKGCLNCMLLEVLLNRNSTMHVCN